MTEENIMRKIKIEKLVLSIGGTADKLEKGCKLLERLTGKKVAVRKTKKRIPTLGVMPGLKVGCLVTLRGKEAENMLGKLFAAENNVIKKKCITGNSFSFGIKEYIEIPGVEYQRDIGIIGFDASVALSRAGKRVSERKIKQGKLPKRQNIAKEEIIEFIKNKFNVSFIGR